ncbi:MAG: Maf family protein [Candidatus Omnitrophica bacterium]|nr:Maf family protein [Candidatus Omnitrophota bacterium]
MKQIILASQSKARSQILSSCGIPHSVVPSRVREIHILSAKPASLVMHNARIKAEEVLKHRSSGVIIGVDTLVLFKGKLIGKPRNKAAAKKILRAFSGNRLLVYSGIHVADAASGKAATGFDVTSLKIKKIPEKDIEKYFNLLGPYDKAGGFSIEGVGSIVFDDIKGSFYNVVGLPTGKLQELFRKINLDLLDFVK